MTTNYIIENIMIFFTASCVLISAIATYKSSTTKDYRPAIFLFLSLVSALYFSSIGRISAHGLVMMVIAYACIFRLKGGWFSSLDIEKNEIFYALSFLYMVRVGVVLLYLSQVIGLEAFWVSSMLFLSMQNLLVLGGCFNGHRRKNNSRITSFRLKLDSLAFSKKGIHS